MSERPEVGGTLNFFRVFGLVSIILVLYYSYINNYFPVGLLPIIELAETSKQPINPPSVEEFETIQLEPELEINSHEACPIYPIKSPSSFRDDNSTVLKILFDEDFKLESVRKLSGAIQIDTQIFDHPPNVDEHPEYWTNFAKFHKYLEQTFPVVYENLEVVKVNTYGLVFYWKGSIESLKPVMLAAHQDVVPIQKDTLSDWSYPPLEGHYDGTTLFGRGSTDCKNILIAIMEMFELLIQKDYKPKRGILAAFGFDEEVSGYKGAVEISKYLEDRFGPKSIYAIIDEGTPIITEPLTGLIIASPAVAEKGYITMSATLKTKGGHSSIPPKHTSIGIVSELVCLLEQNPFPPELTIKNPVFEYLQCLAKHGEKIPTPIRKTILKAGYDKVANNRVVEYLLNLPNPLYRYLIATSQSINIIKGGEKENALPEFTEVHVNHRISVEHSVQDVIDNFMALVKIIATRHNLSVTLDGESIIPKEQRQKGVFTIESSYDKLEPSPVAPTNDIVWEYLAGVSRHLIEDLVKPNLKTPVIVAPVLMPANTDTKHYHNLSGNIFRYTPALGKGSMHNAHSVDEYIPFEEHLQLLAFFYEYVQVIDTEDAGK